MNQPKTTIGAIAMNEALGTHLDEKTARVIRQKGRYQSVREKSL